MRFRLSGLHSAGLCQKNNRTFSSVVDQWNGAHPYHDNPIEVNISINHYPGEKNSTLNVLLETEPTQTWPFNGKLRRHQYDLRFAARATTSAVRCLPWFNEPDAEAIALPPIYGRASRFTMIAADKFSAVSGELYSLRRRLAKEFRDQIDLFGPEWDFHLPKRAKRVLGEILLALRAGAKLSVGHAISYMTIPVLSNGPIRSKSDGYRLNRFALVVENSMELRTEKLYDAIESGCVPVYVGPNCDDGIPKELYIHTNPRFEDVAAAMVAVKEIDLDNWAKLRLTWLESDSYRLSAETRLWDFLDMLSEELDLAPKK